MIPIKLGSLVLSFVFLGGCVAGTTSLVELPQRHTEFDTSGFAPEILKVETPSDSTLTSDQAISSPTFTLNLAIATALKSDPRIAAEFEKIRQAEAELTSAGLIPNPDVSTSASLLPLDRKFTVDRQGGPPQFDVGVSMPIDWFLFGKRAAAIASGQYGVSVAMAEFANTIRLRIAATIGAFYDVLESQSMLELTKENQQNLTEMEKIILNRVSLGGIGTIEADRIKISQFTSRREVRTQELNLAAALNRLRAMLGISENVLITVKGSLDVIKPVKPVDIKEAFKLAEENRPDVIALRQQLVKANEDIQWEERKAYPQVTPNFGYTRQFQQQAIGYPDANSWGAGIDIELPLFDRNQGNIAKAKSLRIQSQHNLEAQLVDLRAEIDQAVKTYASAYQFVTQDDPGQLEAAKSVRDKINQAYELGGKTLIEVLDAQRAYLETYKVHISSHSSYWHALYQLNAAIGKDLLH